MRKNASNNQPAAVCGHINGGYNMSRSYKKPFVKMAKDVEFQKMANPKGIRK